jgi:hypothetical protein
MMNHDILFDADNERIGWAESNCDYHKLVTDSGYADALDGPVDNGTGGGTSSQQNAETPSKVEEEMEQAQEDEKAEDESQVEQTEKGGGGGGEQEDKPSSEQKKNEPEGSDMHDQSSPSDDIQQSLADQCSGLVCRGGVVASLILSCLICACLYRSCCSQNDKVPASAMYQRTPELEMTNGTGRSSSFSSSYKDESFEDEPEDDDDEDEYGGQSAFKGV